MKSELHQKLQTIGRHYALNKSYWVAEEVPTMVGICDVWGISRVINFFTIAIEVKVSRQDFRSRGQKYKERMLETRPQGNTNYILCPANLIYPDEVDEFWGLLWWNGERVVNKKQPKVIETTDRNKLEILIHFLNNGQNDKKPKLELPFLSN